MPKREVFGGGGDVPAVIGAPMHGKVVKDRITSHPEKKTFLVLRLLSCNSST